MNRLDLNTLYTVTEDEFGGNVDYYLELSEKGTSPIRIKCKNGNEYSLKLAGSSYGRSVETIKFFLALVRNNIPVSLYEGEELVARVRADDKIGIVPDGVMPFYCSSYFPDDENISDYMNIELYEDKERWKKVIENVTWQEIEEQRLM